jgi:glycosyltransferase involved in cell wall biosynthesis
MRVLIDGVFFQLASSGGIARVWSSLLKEIVQDPALSLFMLDRGGCPIIPGVSLIAFPSYTMSYTAMDSLLIQEFCDRYEIDVFASTYYTTAVTSPQVQVVYDMIPEAMGFDLSARVWKEKQLALSYASYFACISSNTREDLCKFSPSIGHSRTAITYCGVDPEVLNSSARQNVDALRSKYGLKESWFLFVGSRVQNKGYKNARLFFEAIRNEKTADFDVVCVGGEPTIEPEWLREAPPQVRILRLDLPDEELSAAYAGAIALVYPSLYEGFGMPVVEAMASGCPVITTRYGSLHEVTGDAALIISGDDCRELLEAMDCIRTPAIRQPLIEAGYAQAAKFRWGDAAEHLTRLLRLADAERYDEKAIAFHRHWKKLRLAQAEVDVGID